MTTGQDITPAQLSLLAIITIIGAALRLFDLGGESFWVDEGYSAYMGHLANWREWQVNEHPPLFYALVAVWMRIVDTDIWLRYLPVSFGVITIPIIFYIGRRIFDTNTGLVAAAFMAFTAFHVRYSRDLTMYSLEVFLFSCALWAIVVIATAITLEEQRRGWFFYIASAAPLAWSQGLGPFYVGVVGITLPMLRRDFYSSGLWRSWLISHVIILIFFLPWLTTYLARAQSIAGGFWIPRPDTWAPWRQVYEFTVGSIPSISDRFGVGPDVWIWAVPIYLVLVIVILRGIINRDRPVMALAMGLILPIATVYLVSILVRPIMVTRQMIPAIVPLVLLLAAGSMRVPHARSLRISAFAVVSGLLLLSSSYHLRYMQKENWRDATLFITNKIEDNDVVVFNTYGAFHGYLMGRYDVHNILVNKRQIYIHPQLKLCDAYVASCLESAVITANGDMNYWFVESHEQYLPSAPLVAKWLGERFTVLDRKDLVGVRVWRGKLKDAVRAVN